MFMFMFGVCSYFFVSSDKYQWTVPNIFDNFKCNFAKSMDHGFPLRAGYILTASKLVRLTWFPVSPAGKVQQCTYLVCK